MNEIGKFQIAPMMEWSDRHFRYFFRQISHQATLFTEMVTADAIRFGPRDRLLGFHEAEHPLICQLGGADAHALSEATKIVADYGYDGVSLNCGCPSDRVQAGRFGAALMEEADLVKKALNAMQNASNLPVSIKHRLGLETWLEGDSLKGKVNYKRLNHFARTLYQAGIRDYIVHARIAVLNGLSPKENRVIPPLDYDIVKRLKADFPDAHFTLNGGVERADTLLKLINDFDGIMVGRAAYHDPYHWRFMDKDLYFDDHPIKSRERILNSMLDYADDYLRQDEHGKPHDIFRHLMGLYKGQRGAKSWRQKLSEQPSLDELAQYLASNQATELTAV